MDTLGDIVARLQLHSTTNGWRGDCPLCCGDDSFVLTEREGAAIRDCSSCADVVGIASLIGAMGRVLALAG